MPRRYRLERPFVHDLGRRWIAKLPEHCHWPSDQVDQPTASPLRLLRNGVEVGVPHTLHAEIAERGNGSYSHWPTGFFFSSPENGDPNSDGGVYEVVSVADTLEPHTDDLPRLLAFGSCHAHDPVILLAKNGLARPVLEIPSYALSLTESLQQIRYYNRIVELPHELFHWAFAYPPAQRAEQPLTDRTDIAFVEICNPFPILHRGVVLNRSQLVVDLVEKLQAIHPYIAAAATSWYHVGLVNNNEKIRAEGAAKLLALPDELTGLTPTTREVIEHARVEPRDKEGLKAEVQTLLELLSPTPVVLLSHTLRYMPDGRPISWPGPFYRELNEIAADLSLPIFNSRELVEEYGPAYSLDEDMTHHSLHLHARVAERLMAIAHQVAPTISAVERVREIQIHGATPVSDEAASLVHAVA